MEELAKVISEEARMPEKEPYQPLREAAIKWATHSIKTYDGELLKKALSISGALTEFSNQLEIK